MDIGNRHVDWHWTLSHGATSRATVLAFVFSQEQCQCMIDHIYIYRGSIFISDKHDVCKAAFNYKPVA